MAQSLDSTADPLLGFDSEGSVDETRAETSPVLVRVWADPPDSCTRFEGQSRSRRVSLWSAATVSILRALLIGFASGYRAAQRIGTPRVTPPAASAPPQHSVTQEGFAVAPPFSEANVKAYSTLESAGPGDVQGSVTPAPTATPLGSIEVLSRPSGARVVLDGRVEGQTPLVIREVRAGTHDIRIEAPGFNHWATSVRVARGATTRVGASLEGNGTAH